MTRRLLASSVVAVLAAGGAASAQPDGTSGIDGALFRSSYDTGGIFAVEGARLLPVRDLSLKFLVGYARSPIDVAVPGIGGADADRILDYAITLDMAFGMTLTERLAIGFTIGAYRAATGDGYGVRGRYASGGMIARRSTGLVALRPLSNIDPSADPDDEGAYLGDGLAGPLDARAGLKLGLVQGQHVALALVGSAFLPFGEDEMLLGDRDIVFEPKLAFEWRRDRLAATRIVANAGARIRKRTLLESYDATDEMATDADAQVLLDVGSEIVAGVGGVLELAPRVAGAVEAQVFVPLSGVTYGRCRRYNGDPCAGLTDADYFGDAEQGDLTVVATGGLFFRVSADVTASLMIGTGQIGARGDDVRFTTGLAWAPQPLGAAAPGRGDRDGDRVPDSIDGCPDEAEDADGHQDEDGCPDRDNDGDGLADKDDQCPGEPEDRDGFEDGDGCPEPDNDADGIADVADRCADQPEDRDGFEDEDGCPDADNDRDGFADASDKCPNDPETVNGVEDDDGCPDVRAVTGPEERADRIDLKGAPIAFTRGTATLTAPAKRVLEQVAALIKTRKLAIRVEVHVPLGTKLKRPAQIAAQKRRDKQLAQQRARAVLDYLLAQGVPVQQVQAVGLGSDRPLGADATDAENERVDFIKSQQGGTP